MSSLNKKQVIAQFDNATDKDLFCVFCYDKLLEVEGDNGKELYCPNEMCLNERRYTLKGVEK